MSLENLKSELTKLAKKITTNSNLWNEVEELGSAFPFNEYEYMISHLLSHNTIDLKAYKKLRANYVAKSVNLPLFELAPRTFGERWGQGFIKSICKDFIVPNSNNDSEFDGEYDLILPHFKRNIKIEVKASRATDTSKDKKQLPPITKALAKNTKLKFDMNFQQIKAKCCDVFIFVIVWIDEIDILVLSSDEVKNHSSYNNKQHRGNVDEGQLHIKQNNLNEMYKFMVEPSNLKQAVISKII